MVPDNQPGAGFSDVDRDPHPGALVELLDVRTCVAFHQTYKLQALTRLRLQAGDRVLDVGCGTGADLQTVASQVGDLGHAIGIDSSATMIREAHQRAVHGERRVSLAIADATALPFANDTFAGCLAIRTFQHLAEPEQALSEIVRVLRPDGLVAVVDPDHDTAVMAGSDRNLSRRFLTFRADTIRNGGIAHQMPSLLRKHGFTDIAITPLVDVSTDYAEVERMLNYEGGVRIAQQRGVLSAPEAERLVTEMCEAAASHQFLAAMVYFISTGRKPPKRA